MEEIQPAPDEGTVVYPITFKVLYIQTVVGLGSSEPSTLLGIYIYICIIAIDFIIHILLCNLDVNSYLTD